MENDKINTETNQNIETEAHLYETEANPIVRPSYIKHLRFSENPIEEIRIKPDNIDNSISKNHLNSARPILFETPRNSNFDKKRSTSSLKRVRNTAEINAINKFLDITGVEDKIKQQDTLNSSIGVSRREKIKSCYTKTGEFVLKIIHSKIFTVFFILATLCNLFLYDIAELTIDPQYDYIIDIVLLTTFIFFALEFLLVLIFENNYINSLFFYADLLALVGLIPSTNLLVGGHSDHYTYESHSP